MAFKNTLVVRYAETDQMGIVHHSNYAVWYEEARTEFTKLLGLSYSQMEEMGVVTPLVELTSRYLSPAFYEDVLDVSVTVSELSAARIRFQYEVTRQSDGKLLNRGSTLHAWTGKDLRPFNMRKSEPELYEKIEALMDND